MKEQILIAIVSLITAFIIGYFAGYGDILHFKRKPPIIPEKKTILKNEK